MLKALLSGSTAANKLNADADSFDPPLEAREDLLCARDYLRPMFGGAVYAVICSLCFCVPALLTLNFIPFFIGFGIAAFLVVEMSLIMGLSAFIHHRVFLHRLRSYGSQFYSSKISVDAPCAEAFELCLAATSDLPKSKIVGMDEKNGNIMVSMKGNFWITVDRQVTLKVRPIGTDKSIVSVDPSIKLTPFRKKLIRLIWGDKWYPLIFRSDLSWNRKIINSITSYIESVPNWDHRYVQPEQMDHGFTKEMTAGYPIDLARKTDAA